jgi:hypothetical protein
MNYLVYTPFRCGSSFITRLIQQNLDERSVTFLYELDFNTPSNNLLIKGHDDDISILGNIKIDYTFTSIRTPTEIFVSAFFKDIKEEDYPYHYNKEINRENLSDMMDFFLSIPWHEYDWLCYDFNFNQIKKLTGINLWEENFPKDLGFNKIVKNNNTLIITTHKTLNYNYDQFKDFINTNLLFNNLDMSEFSYRNYDEFNNLYIEFIDKIPAGFYEKYQDIDNKIKEKFL